MALVFASANRDERQFSDPDVLDIARTPKRHLGFGEGIHFFLGAHIARLEARVVLQAVLRTCPRYRIVGSVEQVHKYNERSLRHVPVELF